MSELRHCRALNCYYRLFLMISLVIPTYNEATVIQETLRRAATALRAHGEEFELIVVDDSSADGTAALAETMAADLPIRVLVRPRRLGLATAVLDGWSIARGDVLGVMDADLQHPPEVLTPLAEAIYNGGADLAVGSRYVPGGGTSDWTWWRRLISRTATHMAATVLPLRLASVGDPMSGIFFVRASVVRNAKLNPTGYKILLEVIAKARYRRVQEVPYIFQERRQGGSKLGPTQYLEYLVHLGRLAFATGQFAAWMRYGVVALLGALVDIGLIFALMRYRHLPAFATVPSAIALALLCNSLGSAALTFSVPAGDWFARALRYGRICLAGAILNGVVTLTLLAEGMGSVVSAGAGVAAGGVVNLLFNIPAIWRAWTP